MADKDAENTPNENTDNKQQNNLGPPNPEPYSDRSRVEKLSRRFEP